MLTIAFTGHRPDKIGGYNLPNPTYNHICQNIERILKEAKPDKVISGMALGVDQWAAHIAYRLKIPFIAAIPFINQESKWPIKSQEMYHKLLNVASEKIVVSEGTYSSKKMQTRNEWMVNRCDALIAVWDGSSGGTGNCINYAKSINKPIIYIDPRLDK